MRTTQRHTHMQTEDGQQHEETTTTTLERKRQVGARTQSGHNQALTKNAGSPSAAGNKHTQEVVSATQQHDTKSNDACWNQQQTTDQPGQQPKLVNRLQARTASALCAKPRSGNYQHKARAQDTLTSSAEQPRRHHAHTECCACKDTRAALSTEPRKTRSSGQLLHGIAK